MKTLRLSQYVSGFLAVAMMLAGSQAILSAASFDKHSDDVVDSFLANLAKNSSIDDSRKSEIKKKVDQLREDRASDAITEGLIQIHPNYAKAVDSSDSDDIHQTIALLSPLAKSDDKFLAADASFYLARSLMNNERFEDALPHLTDLTGGLGKYSVHQGNAQYFTAVAQAGLLQNKDAIESFMEFLQFNPDAPERLRVSAWRQVQQLQSIREGKLDDVYQRMDYSRRRLELIETDEATQEQQDQIVVMLNKLIKEEQKKECSSNCKKGGT